MKIQQVKYIYIKPIFNSINSKYLGKLDRLCVPYKIPRRPQPTRHLARRFYPRPDVYERVIRLCGQGQP